MSWMSLPDMQSCATKRLASRSVLLVLRVRNVEPVVQVSCYDKVWQSDTLVPQSLQDDLKDAVRSLADVPEGDKDWHPRSNGLVLDLVHPSLYPLVYGRTFVHKHFDSRSESVEHVLDNRYKDVYAELLNPAFWDISAPALPSEPRDWKANHILKWLIRTDENVKEDLWVLKAEEALKTAENGRWKVLLPLLLPRNRPHGTCVPEPRPDATSVLSGRFAWLPTDFLVGSTGAKALGYINNIHPSHVKLVQTVESLVGAFVPLFERVLTDIMPGNALPLRHRLDNDDESEDAAVRVQRRAHRYSLRGREIQVIVKLANIILVRSFFLLFLRKLPNAKDRLLKSQNMAADHGMSKGCATSQSSHRGSTTTMKSTSSLV